MTHMQNPVELFTTAERDILKLLLESDREVQEFIYSQLSPDEMIHPVARELFEKLYDHYLKSGKTEASVLMNEEAFTDYSPIITRLLAERYEVSERWDTLRGFEEFPVNLQLSNDAVRMLKKWNIKERIETVRKNMQEIEKQGGDTLALTRDLQILHQELKLLDKHYSLTARKPI
jgi:hypothetical protein